MEKPVKHFFIMALELLSSQRSWILVPLILGGALFLPRISAVPGSAEGGFLSVLLVFTMYPVVCGRISELVKGERFVSFHNLLRRHLLNFIVVNLALGIPVMFISVALTLMGISDTGISRFLMILVDLAGIYIFPMLFLTEKRVSSMIMGLTFLVKNISFNLPLVAASVAVIFINTMAQEVYAQDSVLVSVVLIKYLVWFFSVCADFLIFTTACLIIRDICYSK